MLRSLLVNDWICIVLYRSLPPEDTDDKKTCVWLWIYPMAVSLPAISDNVSDPSLIRVNHSLCINYKHACLMCWTSDPCVTQMHNWFGPDALMHYITALCISHMGVSVLKTVLSSLSVSVSLCVSVSVSLCLCLSVCLSLSVSIRFIANRLGRPGYIIILFSLACNFIFTRQ